MAEILRMRKILMLILTSVRVKIQLTLGMFVGQFLKGSNMRPLKKINQET